jgi:hypothetical protein
LGGCFEGGRALLAGARGRPAPPLQSTHVVCITWALTATQKRARPKSRTAKTRDAGRRTKRAAPDAGGGHLFQNSASAALTRATQPRSSGASASSASRSSKAVRPLWGGEGEEGGAGRRCGRKAGGWRPGRARCLGGRQVEVGAGSVGKGREGRKRAGRRLRAAAIVHCSVEESGAARQPPFGPGVEPRSLPSTATACGGAAQARSAVMPRT